MEISIKTAARAAGALYLVNIVLGFFAIGYVPGMVITKDAESTARNMLAHEEMYRLGLVAHLIILLTNIPLGVIFLRIFKPVSRPLALAIIFITLVATAVEIANLLNQFMPLVLLKQGGSGFSPAQLTSLSYMYHRLELVGVNLAFFFFGFYGMGMGTLIIRSGFLPRAIGVLMAIGGCCYVLNSVAGFLSPPFASKLVPYILVPSGLSELIFCLWLLIVGLNKDKWEQRAAGSGFAGIPDPL